MKHFLYRSNKMTVGGRNSCFLEKLFFLCNIVQFLLFTCTSNAILAHGNISENSQVQGHFSKGAGSLEENLKRLANSIANSANTGLNYVKRGSGIPATAHNRRNPSRLQTTSGVGTQQHDRVILAYSTDGCKRQTSRSFQYVKNPSDPSDHLWGQEASNETMHILRDRIAQLLHMKQMNLASISSTRSHLEGYISSRTAISSAANDFESRYLSMLQMEVIKAIPKGVTDTEVISLTTDLPCIENAFRDEIKFSESKSSSIPVVEMLQSGGKRKEFIGQLMKTDTDDGIWEQEADIAKMHPNPSQLSRYLSKQELLANDASLDIPAPNDPQFPYQWNLHHAELGMKAQSAWKIWKGIDRSTVVAVIDSGCDLDHPDLIDKKWHNFDEICDDGIDNDGNGYIDDCYGWDFVHENGDFYPEGSGHGTGAAGILGASTNNLHGISGVCWGCQIMCLKFIGDGQGSVSNQIQAIDYAIKMKARISNNSYGGYGISTLEYQAIRRAQSFDHLFVTSAGNHNLNTDIPINDHTPSTYPLANVISVAASAQDGEKAPFSNFGRNSVHVFAPGTDIATTEPGGGYSVVSGTSFAAPHVAGASALLWSAFPSLSLLQVKAALMESCSKTTLGISQTKCGGVINLQKSLLIAARMAEGVFFSKFERTESQDGLSSSNNNYFKKNDEYSSQPAAAKKTNSSALNPQLLRDPKFRGFPQQRY